MTPTFTHAVALVAGLAIIATWFVASEKRLLASLAVAIGLCIIAAVLIRIVA